MDELQRLASEVYGEGSSRRVLNAALKDTSLPEPIAEVLGSLRIVVMRSTPYEEETAALRCATREALAYSLAQDLPAWIAAPRDLGASPSAPFELTHEEFVIAQNEPPPRPKKKWKLGDALLTGAAVVAAATVIAPAAAALDAVGGGSLGGGLLGGKKAPPAEESSGPRKNARRRWEASAGRKLPDSWESLQREQARLEKKHEGVARKHAEALERHRAALAVHEVAASKYRAAGAELDRLCPRSEIGPAPRSGFSGTHGVALLAMLSFPCLVAAAAVHMYAVIVVAVVLLALVARSLFLRQREKRVLAAEEAIARWKTRTTTSVQALRFYKKL
ncbi:MAG: hypothetical protein GY913_02175 [Proteobacteria bacterium]|nr:hypothetical protein [Pseudomonadota bacterium]